MAATVPPLQLCVRAHKGALRRLGIKPLQAGRGAFEFLFSYTGIPPYWGRRWNGMIDRVTVVPLPNGEFLAYGLRVDRGELVPTGTLFGTWAALCAGDGLVRLLGRLKLCGGGSDPGGPTLPPPGETVRITPDPAA